MTIKLQRCHKTGLLFERCPSCNSIIERIPELGRDGCWCEISRCVSCTDREKAIFNLCRDCDEAYIAYCHEEGLRPIGNKAARRIIRKCFNNLITRHGFRDGDNAYPAFYKWWLMAHRSFVLHFQDRAKFDIHRGNDFGAYTIGSIFMTPKSENNLIRQYCRMIDDYADVLKFKEMGYTLQQIEDITNVRKPTASRWINYGLKITEPKKCPFNERLGRA